MSVSQSSHHDDRGAPLGCGAVHHHLTAWGYLLDKAIATLGSKMWRQTGNGTRLECGLAAAKPGGL
jgi:hypothetical protein